MPQDEHWGDSETIELGIFYSLCLAILSWVMLGFEHLL